MSQSRRVPLTVLAIAFAAVFVAAADDEAKPKPEAAIVPVRAPGNVFGGKEAEYKFTVEAKRAVKGRATWRLAAGTATVTAGEMNFAAAPDSPATIAIKLAVPPLKDGVVLATKLTISAIEAGQNKPIATHEQDVWAFPEDPFADKAEWLKGLKLKLYDPVGATSKLLAAAKVPFEELRDVDAVAGSKEGVVIVGEGVSFKEERGLAAALDKLAAGGRVVLCLAPADGELVVPGLGGPADQQQELSFRRDIVRQLDKRFDPDGWAVDAKTVASTIAVKSSDGSAVGEVAPAGGWPWAEARYAHGGRWAVCGLAVVPRWEASPTPRFLLVRMLEHLTEPEQPKTEPKKESDR